jgi:MFS transporter, PPP family, 3-phenylpropionic acid transporter
LADASPSSAPLRVLPPLFFLALAVVGAVYPFLALDLRERGVSPLDLALTMSIAPLMNLFAAPLWGAWADRSQQAGRLTALAAGLGVVGVLLLALAPVALVPAAMLVFGFARAPTGPLLDGMAVLALGGDRGAYGRLRRWGSLGFLGAVFAAPLLWEHLGLSPLLQGALLGVFFFLLSLALPAGERLPARPILPALRAMAGDPVLPWLLALGALHFSAHVAGTSFLAVHFDAIGIARSWSGAVLALGVAVEIALFSVSPWLLRRFGAWRLMGLAVAVALPRWVLTGLFDGLLPQIALGASHGLSFGAFWIAGVALISERAPPGLELSAQGLWSAAVGGLGALLGNLSAALVIAVAPTRAMFAAAAVAAAVATACALRADQLRRRLPAPPGLA